MKKTVVIALSVVGAIVLLTCIGLSIYFATKQSSGPGPALPSPQDQCNKNGYVWDPVKQVCTTNQCIATVDTTTGVLTGNMINVSGNACVDVSSGSYVSPFARAALLQVCQAAGFQNLEPGTSNVLQCTNASGCSTKPFVTNTFMDGCPFLTYQPSGNTCVPPSSTQLEYLCNTSVNGCPLSSSLNTNCPASAPCFDPNNGCQPQLAVPGCRPRAEQWQWLNNQCINITVSNTIAVTIQSSTVDEIQGTFVFTPPSSGTKLQWLYLLTDGAAVPKTWQGPVVVQGSSFNVSLTGLGLTVDNVYSLTLQVYTSVNDSPYVLSFQSVTPSLVKLGPAPVAPGLLTIKPVLSLDLAQAVAADVQTAVNTANGNSAGSNPFVQPSPGTWTNSLQGTPGGTQQFLLVPCTTAYCLTGGVAMLILAWPVITQLSSDQLAEIQKSCPSIQSPKVSYAVYMNDKVVGNQLTAGTWIAPVPSDPTVVSTFKILAYVWSEADTGIEKNSCTSQPLEVVVQAPTNLYSPQTCFAIQPLKPEGVPIPGNFMLYHPGSNMCSAPQDLTEALGARDFTCLTASGPPSLTNMQLYACNDMGGGSSDCNSSGQGCETVFPVTSVRQPSEGESSECQPLPSNNVPPCGGSQYCQLAACNCPTAVQWSLCGSSSFASVGADKAIESQRWQSRVANVANLIKTYGLDNVKNVQTFLNDTASPQNVQTVWDTTYGSGVCPLPNWSAPNPAPGTCDFMSATACKQVNVCDWWKREADSTLFKQKVYVYPTEEQQPNCCPSLFKYYAGCCCPSTDSGSDSCADLKNCVPLDFGTGDIGPAWCNFT